MSESEPTTDRARAALVDALREAGVVRDPRVAEALSRVPRHAFVPPDLALQSYVDAPLAIGEGQTISAPHVVAMMLEALDVRPGMRVLEVGGGSGYHAAALAEMATPGGRVWSVERHATLAERARRVLEAAGYADRVEVVVGDGSAGLPAAAPFDRVSVACAAPALPPPLVHQLARPGRLVLPVGRLDVQDLTLVERDAAGEVALASLGPVAFVPLVGRYGFSD